MAIVSIAWSGVTDGLEWTHCCFFVLPFCLCLLQTPLSLWRMWERWWQRWRTGWIWGIVLVSKASSDRSLCIRHPLGVLHWESTGSTMTLMHPGRDLPIDFTRVKRRAHWQWRNSTCSNVCVALEWLFTFYRMYTNTHWFVIMMQNKSTTIPTILVQASVYVLSNIFSQINVYMILSYA